MTLWENACRSVADFVVALYVCLNEHPAQKHNQSQKAQKMESDNLFFLLPADLQIDILHGWLNSDDCGSNLLKVLSTMVACSKLDQPSLRFLMDQLPPFGEYKAHRVSRQVRRHVAKCLQWLVSRNVPVRSLLLAGKKMRGLDGVEPNLALLHIESLHWNVEEGSAEELAVVMQCLPNLTELRQNGTRRPILVNTSLAPKLTMLSILAYPAGNVSPLAGASPQLMELRMGHFRLTAELADDLEMRCLNLQLLEVSMWNMNFTNLLRVLQACLSLKELVLHDLSNHLAEIVAFANIKRLTFSGFDPLYIDLVTAIDVIGRYPEVEYFTTEGFAYSRKDGQLELPLYQGLTSGQLLTILSSFSSVQVFSWNSLVNSDMTFMLADKCSGSLRSLTVRVRDSILDTLLQRCGATLTNLDLDCCDLDTCPLKLIAATCPQLVSLSLSEFEHLRLREGASVLFASSLQLKELTLTIRRGKRFDRKAALREVILQRRQLRLLTLVGIYYDSDADWFRYHAEEHQVLPVPVIVVITE